MMLIGIAVKQKKELHIERRWAFSLTQNRNKMLLAFLTSILASRFYVLQYSDKYCIDLFFFLQYHCGLDWKY